MEQYPFHASGGLLFSFQPDGGAALSLRYPVGTILAYVARFRRAVVQDAMVADDPAFRAVAAGRFHVYCAAVACQGGPTGNRSCSDTPIRSRTRFTMAFPASCSSCRTSSVIGALGLPVSSSSFSFSAAS